MARIRLYDFFKQYSCLANCEIFAGYLSIIYIIPIMVLKFELFECEFDIFTFNVNNKYILLMFYENSLFRNTLSKEEFYKLIIVRDVQ